MGRTGDDIDKFVTTVHGKNYVRALSKRNSIPVGVIMHLKALHFRLYDRNKCYALTDVVMLADIDIAQLIVTRRTRNQNSCNSEILKQTSLPELMVPKFTTPNFESFMNNFK